VSDLLERRARAIETSGWGARFHFIQPHNACFWVYLALLGSGLWFVFTTVQSTASTYAQAYTASLLAGAAFTAVFLGFLHHADRWERTPGNLALAAFLIGGFGATFAIAITGNAAMMSLYAKLLGQPFAQDWQAGLTAPFVEESSKAICFLLLMGLAPVVIRTVSDGLIVGAYVGLGFQVLEDLLYGQNAAAAQFGANQTDAVLGTFALRALTGISSHALYTALFAAGLIYALGTPAQPRRLGRGIALMASAVLIHGVWDSAAAIGGQFFVIFVLLGTIVFSLVALYVAIRWAGKGERAIMRDILAPEVAAGTLTELELHALTGHRKERRRALKAGGRRREKHVLEAARDLAQDLSAGDGEDTPAVMHSRAEIARLRG
jgi:RsiW-degrading membrane proteinase PrsW (M82 family)